MWSPCLAESYCGDGTCDASDFEDRVTCEDDCAVCGDGYCDGAEDRDSCEADCLPVACVPDDTYCSGSEIRRCVSDGAASVLVEDCAVSAGGSTFTECTECPSSGTVSCTSSVAIISGGTIGVMTESLSVQYEPGVCPGETCAVVDYDPTDGLIAYAELPDGRWAEIWIGWWALYPGVPLAFTHRNSTSPPVQVSAWTGVDLWQSWAACWWCGSFPPSGSLTADWTGDLGPGTVVHLYGSGHLTPDWGRNWTPQALDLYLLVL
jgi:hypothetical protein